MAFMHILPQDTPETASHEREIRSVERPLCSPAG